MKLAQIATCLAAATLTTACTTHSSPPASSDLAAVRIFVVQPAYDDRYVVLGGYDRAEGHDDSRRLIIPYTVRGCLQSGACSVGIAKPEISLHVRNSAPNSVKFETVVDYSVAPEQVLESGYGGISNKVTQSVDGDLKFQRSYSRLATLNFGEHRMLRLPFGDAIIFCALRVKGQLKDDSGACQAPPSVNSTDGVPEL